MSTQSAERVGGGGGGGSINRCHQRSNSDHLSIGRVLEGELGGSMSPACEQEVQRGEFEMREQRAGSGKNDKPVGEELAFWWPCRQVCFC